MSSKKIPSLSVTDGFDFVQKIWGSLPIPSVMSPTTDLDELDKRISDLKTVEQWLNVNLSMLHATIQGLEVQRGTIAAIKSFSYNMGLGGDRPADAQSSVNEDLIRKAMQAAAAPTPSAQAPTSGPNAHTEADAAAQESSKAIVSNATAWWGLLQDQFNKVASAAIPVAGQNAEAPSVAANAPVKPVAKSAVKPAVKPKAKRAPAARKKTTSTTRTRT